MKHLPKKIMNDQFRHLRDLNGHTHTKRDRHPVYLKYLIVLVLLDSKGFAPSCDKKK